MSLPTVWSYLPMFANNLTKKFDLFIRLNLPNRITLCRIFLVPVMLVFLISPSTSGSFIAALIFAAAAFTDWLDGHLARANHQITTLGKLLDPIADKLLITATLIPLVALGRVSPWIAVILIGREFAVTGLRGIAAAKGVIIAASNWGKYKMLCQVVALILLILYYPPVFIGLGQGILYLSLFLSVASGIDYFRSFWQNLDLIID